MGTHTATQGAGSAADITAVQGARSAADITAVEGARSAADNTAVQGTPHEEMARLQQVFLLDTHCSDVFRKIIELAPKHDLIEQEDNHDAAVDAVYLCAAVDAVCRRSMRVRWRK